jgi:hypothetical protein
MNWRSKKILERPEWSMNRALYKGMGYSDYDLDRPTPPCIFPPSVMRRIMKLAWICLKNCAAAHPTLPK